MKQVETQSWGARLAGYLLIPHEILHVLGYRLMGRRCVYRWGDSQVIPPKTVTRPERLVGMLFPFAIFSLLTIGCGVCSTLAYRYFLQGGTLIWFVGWTTGALIAGAYAGTTVIDLRQAYLLIFDKPWYSWTPFDLFFWPAIDWNDVRRKVASGELDDPTN